ncbi:putative peptidyl-trna hydrolase protein [Phaeoacremonium minimum UCRPA7]|uniref:peptidyl-tRNA hydrolase n=1 Tax=Phaeoacremonium minimum (strain UCR-PA7) TaxID=1286976 RepID=R8BXA3_PHAM7|nr:putative peptidyl-trna hydrolase protein [Phaeoacremonium minimum UCRPA7]EOO04031.1 putative peptidyl-trna hydrolase protein [Phaeoacremonium minimum UCRPA7]
MFSPRFLVVSLGNPAPYADTLHSAGHLALVAAQKQLQGTQPPFSSSRYAKKSAQASVGPKYTFLQSPAVMNVSGLWVARAYREILADSDVGSADMGLILVHDDLEEDLGVVKIRKWERSHRGHNGVKSVNASLRRADYQGSLWARISVGIGRPADRDQRSVSDYVLRPMSQHQKMVLAEKAGPGVVAALMELESQWQKDTVQAAAKESA